MSDDEPPRLVSSSAEGGARARAEELVGKILSKRYRVDEVLAMGGMGAVYRGEHTLLHKRIAIKVLHREIEGLPDLVKRFEREAVAGAHIVHPNVASATDFGELDDGSYFLVLEYVRGVTLFDVIRRGALAPVRAAQIARQLAGALAACHDTGIVHRDVKPKNVMVSEEQEDATKLIDFGLASVRVDRLSTLVSEDEARQKLEEGRLSGVGMIFGTIAYLAPEAALGMDAVDARSDLYALGLLFYEMLSGKHPFDAVDPIELFRLQRTGTVPTLADRAPDAPVPAALEAVVFRLLEKDPAARYQTGHDVVAAIDEALLACGLATVSPPKRSSDWPGPLGLAAVESTSTSGTMIEAAPEDVTSTPPPEDDARWSPTAERSAKPAIALDWRGPLKPEAPPRRSPLQVALVAVAVVVATAAVATVKLTTGSGARPVVAQVPRRPAILAAPRPALPVHVARFAIPAPSASGAPSAEPSAEASAGAATAGPPFDAEVGKLELLKAAGARAWPDAEAAFLALANHAPQTLRDHAVSLAMRDLVVSLEREGRGDQVYTALAEKLGGQGVDVLYDIVQARGGSKAAERATAMLKEPTILAKASPEVRVAFELREAPCEQKAALLDRAVKEGDGRALAVLKTLGTSCLRRNRALAHAILELTEKIQKSEGYTPPPPRHKKR